MGNSIILKNLVHLDMDVRDQKDFFVKICSILGNEGYIKDTYLDALISREASYPTALPTQPNAVAIPHADPEHLIKPFVASIRLKQPIPWCEMATSDQWLKVRLVFVLGFTKEGGHIEMLQTLVDCLQDVSLQERLINAPTVDDYYEVVKNIK